MQRTELSEHLRLEYERIHHDARSAPVNQVPPDLPVKLLRPGTCQLLPAGSLAIQTLVPADSPLNASLQAVVTRCQERFSPVADRAFWQPPGTFHLNGVILKRLSREPIARADLEQILAKTAPLLDWLDALPAYEVDFRGVLVRATGTIMATGFPLTPTPWAARRHFAAHGFPDQQGIFHITLGRILEPLAPELWRRFLAFVEEELVNRPLGTLVVKGAMLISESEGFLHAPSSYKVLRHFRWFTIADRQ